MTMSFAKMILTSLLLSVALSAAYAGGGKNGYNNPTGDPADDTYRSPYVGMEDQRTMIFCAEDEMLVVTPVDDGSAEATCVRAAD